MITRKPFRFLGCNTHMGVRPNQGGSRLAGGGCVGELKTFFSVFFWSRIRTEIRGFFWPWPWRISRISVRISVLAEVGEN